MRAAYADPPYIGLAWRYKDQPVCAEVDHADLIARLGREYDCWALSCHTPSLKAILAMCPDDVRVMAWIKPFCSFKPGVGVAYAWEPLILCGGRKRTRAQGTVRDWCSESITLRKGFIGRKPARLMYWLFDVMNLGRGDTLDDLYPGSGAVTEAWNAYQRKWKQDTLELVAG